MLRLRTVVDATPNEGRAYSGVLTSRNHGGDRTRPGPTAPDRPRAEGPRIRRWPRPAISETISRPSWTSLAEHFQDIPALIIACVEGRPEGLLPERLAGLYGNILPITWSLMLALRARGIGAAWTTIVFKYEKEVAELLRIPAHMTPEALLPVAYFKGDDFKPARCVPARERTHWNTWGSRR